MITGEPTPALKIKGSKVLAGTVLQQGKLWFRAKQIGEDTAHHVVAMNTPGQNANSVAELVFGLLVYAVRNFYNGTSGTELMGKKLGILAFGNVGRNVARIAKGFGMEVYAYDAFCPKEAIEAAGVKAVDSQDDLFKTCDVVSLHIPATPETKQSINYATLLAPKSFCVTASGNFICRLLYFLSPDDISVSVSVSSSVSPSTSS